MERTPNLSPMAHKFTRNDSVAGGVARAKALTKDQRRAIAKRAIAARWAMDREKKAKAAARKSAA